MEENQSTLKSSPMNTAKFFQPDLSKFLYIKLKKDGKQWFLLYDDNMKIFEKPTLYLNFSDNYFITFSPFWG